MKRRVLAVLASGMLLFGAAPQPDGSVPADAQTVIDRMVARDASLASYEARVHVNLRMLNFPFLAPTLDGTSYYKRPDSYEVVFDRMPSYAKGFERIFNDVDDPRAWQQDENIRVEGTQTVDGRPLLVLDLTKKIHSDILDHTLAFVDPSTYQLLRMEWHYTSGGVITMTQQYRTQDGYSFVGAQHVVIDIPHVHAVGDSTFGTYQTNIAVSNAVFSKQ